VLYQIGQLVVDTHTRSKNNISLFDAKPEDFEQIYVFGLIITTEPISLEDKYYQLYKDSFVDNTSYTILWCDYEEPITRYSAGHIKKFIDNLESIEKEMQNDNVFV
jgi:hypothetical protein